MRAITRDYGDGGTALVKTAREDNEGKSWTMENEGQEDGTQLQEGWWRYNWKKEFKLYNYTTTDYNRLWEDYNRGR